MGANCFNAVQLFWKDTEIQEFVGPEAFVSYIGSQFEQISLDEKYFEGDVTLVWSRSSNVLSVGHIKLKDLISKKEGYPFGLVIEHAFVELDGERVFQKPDPKPSSKCGILRREEAMNPYVGLKGFEITRHRRRSNEEV